jgi:hypothetical protein
MHPHPLPARLEVCTQQVLAAARAHSSGGHGPCYMAKIYIREERMSLSLVSAGVRARSRDRRAAIGAVALWLVAASCTSGGAPTSPSSPSSPSSPANSQSGSISGVVSSSLGGGLPGFNILVTPTGQFAFAPGTPGGKTRSDGSYTISHVAAGGGLVSVAIPPSWHCIAPAAAAYSGVTVGGMVTVNITVPCMPSP